MNLRKLARGRDCQIRVPGVCLRTTETVVLCHYRMSRFSGMSLKSPDWCGAYGCAACHDIVDGRTGDWAQYTLVLRKLFLAEAVLRTLQILFEEGLFHVGKNKTNTPRAVASLSPEVPLPRILPRRTSNAHRSEIPGVAADGTAEPGEVA